MHKREELDRFRSAIPFLQNVPDEVYYSLDTSEFHLPGGEISSAREELEAALGFYVMTYNRLVFNLHKPLEAHLCVHVQGAELDKEQLGLLEQYEGQTSVRNVSLVVYQRPLILINPIDSPLATVYDT